MYHAKKQSYPVTLPYTHFVVDVLNHLADLIDKNLDYWQFLLNDMSDFDLVTDSCNEILRTAGQLIYLHIEEQVFENPSEPYSLMH
mgnify:CR=1 FL=1